MPQTAPVQFFPLSAFWGWSVESLGAAEKLFETCSIRSWKSCSNLFENPRLKGNCLITTCSNLFDATPGKLFEAVRCPSPAGPGKGCPNLQTTKNFIQGSHDGSGRQNSCGTPWALRVLAIPRSTQDITQKSLRFHILFENSNKIT